MNISINPEQDRKGALIGWDRISDSKKMVASHPNRIHNGGAIKCPVPATLYRGKCNLIFCAESLTDKEDGKSFAIHIAGSDGIWYEGTACRNSGKGYSWTLSFSEGPNGALVPVEAF